MLGEAATSSLGKAVSTEHCTFGRRVVELTKAALLVSDAKQGCERIVCVFKTVSDCHHVCALCPCRYLVSSTLRLWADITTLHTACQLQPATACRMLLAAPRLAGTPASFWQLLLQYVLFLVPQWRQEVSEALLVNRLNGWQQWSSWLCRTNG